MPSSQPSICSPIPRLAFLRAGESILVRAPESVADPRPPQVMSKVSAGLVTWLMATADAFFEDHKRHLVFQLLFSPNSLRWIPELPIQTCRTDGVAWSLSREGLPPIDPTFFLAGTFQSHPSPEISVPVMPPIPGVHFIYHPAVPEGQDCLQAAVGFDYPARSELINLFYLIAPNHESFLKYFAPRFQLR